MVVSVPGCGERETRGEIITQQGSDWDTNELFLKNGRAEIHFRRGEVR